MLLHVDQVSYSYHQGKHVVQAVQKVDLHITHGESIGLVGESGCGKTTLGRLIAGILAPSEGTIQFLDAGREIPVNSTEYRRRVQMVFQHPGQSLNPKYRVGRTIADPLRFLKGIPLSEIDVAVEQGLCRVGLDASFSIRRPLSLSGGQQQRVAIARALASGPGLLVLDEPTSSLDPTIQSRILRLLSDLQSSQNVSYLFISHDLSVVERLCQRVAVMYAGQIIELCDKEQLFSNPLHPYSKSLLAAVPKLNVGPKRKRVALRGEVLSLSESVKGCSFQSRCPFVHDKCWDEAPKLDLVDSRRSVACHLPYDELAATELRG